MTVHTPSPVLERVNVLLVDDRPDKLLALESILSETGQNVLTARSGEEALRHLLRDDFAVILLDVNMPRMNGFETAALIRERQRSEKTPIIFLTAASDAEGHAALGYSLGAVDYIHLPVRPEVLKAKVAVFVDLYLKSEKVRRQAEWMRTTQETEHAARLAEAAHRLDFETRRNRFFTLAVDMLGIVGFDGYFRQLNPSWERTLGFTEEELRGGTLTRLVHPDDREAMETELRRLAEGAASSHFENRHLHRDGSYRWLAWTATPFTEEGLVYVFVQDVTFRKKAEEERLELVREQEARRLAQRENDLKDQFLATLSHELRAPLTPILGWTSMLRSGRLDPSAIARGLDVIDRNVRLEAQLVEDLLDVSRIVSGKLRVELRPMDFAVVVEAGMDAIRAAAAAKHLETCLSLSERPILVNGDPERLQQVVSNLLTNAIKFTPGGGRIDVRLERSAARVELSVRDTGIGIRPDFLPHAFERFRQAETGSARAHGGLGLGLTIVHHLVAAHSGLVRAESEGVGKGATFVVSLPALEDEAAWRAAKVAGSDSKQVLLEGLKVLVVDDEAEVREVLRVSLEQLGAWVSSAASAEEALSSIDREVPDVVVCDIGLPGTDGCAFMERVRARAPERGGTVRAVALTAYASRQDSARTEAAGFHVHLAKPVDPRHVAEALFALMRSRA